LTLQNRKYFLILVAVYFFFTIFFLQPWINRDGLQYYALIHSPIIDGDLDFTNEFRDHNPRQHFVPNVELKTSTGLVFNVHAVGSSLMNAPFFLLAHLISLLGGLPTDHGYYLIYTGAYNLGTTVYSFFGSWIIFIILSKYLSYKKTDSFIATLLIVLATPLFYYSFSSASFSHGHSFFAVSLFILIWLKFRDNGGTKYWIMMGLCAGLIFLIRSVDIVFVALPIIDLILFKRDLGSKIIKTLANIPIYFGSVIISFFPQMIYWKILYGQFIATPQPVEKYYLASGYFRTTFMDWANPHFIEFLFSLRHGLISWHPFFLLPLIGYYFLFKKHREITIIAVIMTGLVFYMHSVPWDWWGGAAFGQRRVADISPFLALGLVALLDRLNIYSIKSKITKAAMLLIFPFWNIIFMIQWLIELSHQDEVDIVNQVIPNFMQWETYLVKMAGASTIIKSASDLTTNLNAIEGLIIRLVLWSLPSVILLIIAFYKDLVGILRKNEN